MPYTLTAIQLMVLHKTSISQKLPKRPSALMYVSIKKELIFFCPRTL